MDGKYVKFFQNKKGFIEKLEIVGDEVHVYTSASKKGEPEKYPLEEKITEYSQILETQYRLITPEQNAKIIKKDIMDAAKKKVNFTTIGIAGLLAIVGSVTLALDVIAVPLISLACIPALLVTRNIVLNQKSQNIDKEMDMVRTYLNYRQDIETQSEKNPNVTRYLSETTKHRITINEEYKKDNLIDDIYDIILMDELLDKKKLKDLETLLNHYIISKSLEQPQAFINPEENNFVIAQSKTRTRKK